MDDCTVVYPARAHSGAIFACIRLIEPTHKTRQSNKNKRYSTCGVLDRRDSILARYVTLLASYFEGRRKRGSRWVRVAKKHVNSFYVLTIDPQFVGTLERIFVIEAQDDEYKERLNIK